MAGVVTIKSNIPQVQQALRMFPRDMQRGARKVLSQNGRELRAKLVHLSTTNVRRRTGTLARGWTHEVVDMSLVIVNETKYAAVHEEGATITARTRKFLAIPLDAVKTGAGVARFSPRDLPRQLSFVAKDIIFRKKTRSDHDPTAMFKLQRSVTLKPRLKATEAFMAQVPKIERDWEQEVLAIWDRG